MPDPFSPVDPPGPADRGFTLVELAWTMVVFGVVAATAVVSLRGWTSAQAEQDTALTLVADMRWAQQEAVTEGRPICLDVDVSAQAYSVYRGACDDPGRMQLRGPIHPQQGTALAAPAFAGTSAVSTGVTFLPRGTAWPGTVQVTRSGVAKVWTITVTGLTGMVSYA